MSKFEEYTATLPAHWASALINADPSGLSDEEEKELYSFLAANPEYSQPVGCSEESEFCHYHDGPGLPGDCLVYSYLRAL